HKKYRPPKVRFFGLTFGGRYSVTVLFLRINGVQKLASAVISPAKLKTLGAVFTWLFLLLDAEQLFYNLSNKRCSISCPSILAQKTAKYEELFCRLFL
ncbi:hypothetical protein, partial [Enterococcus faecium]